MLAVGIDASAFLVSRMTRASGIPAARDATWPNNRSAATRSSRPSGFAQIHSPARTIRTFELNAVSRLIECVIPQSNPDELDPAEVEIKRNGPFRFRKCSRTGMERQ